MLEPFNQIINQRKAQALFIKWSNGDIPDGCGLGGASWAAKIKSLIQESAWGQRNNLHCIQRSNLWSERCSGSEANHPYKNQSNWQSIRQSFSQSLKRKLIQWSKKLINQPVKYSTERMKSDVPGRVGDATLAGAAVRKWEIKKKHRQTTHAPPLHLPRFTQRH